jgi:galactokinase
MRDQMRATFRQQFGEGEEPVIVRSPGRLNLLGEHTDYNAGLVLPIAINRATWVACGPASGQVRVWSETFSEEDAFDPADFTRDAGRLWVNYVRGVVWALAEAGVTVPGANLVISGDLPLSAGLSSSASVETGCALALLALVGQQMPKRDLALLCQKAENDFVGMRCGILDQFAVGLCEAGHALLLDCRDQSVQHIPLHGEAPVFFVCDTAKPRELADSEYNQRRALCESVAAHYGVPSLREVSLEQLERDRGELGDVAYRRCRHVLTENARVEAATAVLSEGRWEDLGSLISASHASLRDDYEVSCAELNIMCELAESAAGCLGARLVGAGFGGCAMAAVRGDAADDFGAHLAEQYQAATGRVPQVFAVQAGAGAAVV